MNKHIPCMGNVLIRVQKITEEETTAGGIVLPKVVSMDDDGRLKNDSDRFQVAMDEGVVMAIGPLVHEDMGLDDKPDDQIKVGDHVTFTRHAGRLLPEDSLNVATLRLIRAVDIGSKVIEDKS